MLFSFYIILENGLYFNNQLQGNFSVFKKITE